MQAELDAEAAEEARRRAMRSGGRERESSRSLQRQRHSGRHCPGGGCGGRGDGAAQRQLCRRTPLRRRGGRGGRNSGGKGDLQVEPEAEARTLRRRRRPGTKATVQAEVDAEAAAVGDEERGERERAAGPLYFENEKGKGAGERTLQQLLLSPSVRCFALL